MIHGHGGNIHDLAEELGCNVSDIIDMSSNVNPLGPPEGLIEHLTNHLSTILSLPEVDAGSAIARFSARYDVDAECVFAGNGTTQLLYTIPRALETRRAAIVSPTYADYTDACAMNGVTFEHFMLKEEADFVPDFDSLSKILSHVDTVFICNPNNPTGVYIDTGELASFCRSHPDTRFIIDESYLPFENDGASLTVTASRSDNIVVMNSMSKIFRIPGLRIGYVTAPKPIITRFSRYAQPWSVNSLAQLAVRFLMERREETDKFVERTRAFLRVERDRLYRYIAEHSGIKCYPSMTSFVLCRLPKGHTAEDICRKLALKGILIRNCSNFTGLDHRFIRISLKTEDINKHAVELLTELVAAR